MLSKSILRAESTVFSPTHRACPPPEKHILANQYKIKQFLTKKIANKFMWLLAAPWPLNCKMSVGS